MKNKNLINYMLEIPNFLSLFLFAFFMMLSSPILMDISKYFSATPENMNLIMTFFMAGQAVGLISLIFLNKKFNNIKITISTYLLLIFVSTGLILVKSLIFFYLLYFVVGFLFGIIFMNANVSMLEGRVKNKESVVNLGHGFFAIGAIVSPVFSTNLIKMQINWRFIYLFVIGLAIISLLSYIFTYKKKQPDIAGKIESLPLRELFKNKEKNIYMAFTVILMLLYVMSEVTIFSWGPTFFRIEKLFDIDSAGMIISVFWAGILAGRLLISFISYKIKAGSLLVLLSAVSITGLIVAIFPMDQAVNFVGAALIGLGFSGIPPLLISTAGKIFGTGKEISLTVLFTAGITGGSLIPFAIRLISRFSIFLSIAISLILMVIFTVFVFIRKSYRKKIKAN